MIFSDCFGDYSKKEFDLIVRGNRNQVKHELMHVLLSMSTDDVMDIIEMWLRQIMEDLEETNETN